MPIYPSLSFIGRDASASVADYDESTIITAYSDVDNNDNPYISESGLVTLDIDSSSKEDIEEDKIEQIAKAPEKKAPIITQYTVVAGDSLAKLSERYDISIEAIVWANDMRTTDILKPGMTLKIPPISGVIHRVVKGDTLSEIAGRYKIDIDDIIRVNRLTDAGALRVGTDLVIPGAVRKTQVTNVAKATADKPVPVPSKVPTTTPVTLSPTKKIKSAYAIEYTGKGRGFV